jgi:serine/threonine protein kinase/Flp pilus assembly protein TadD
MSIGPPSLITLPRRTLPASLVAGPSDGPAARARQEMARRWESGDHVLTEEILSRHPELQDNSRAAIELIHEEICLRHDHGKSIAPGELFDRFPHLRDDLELLLECDRLLEGSPEPEFPVAGEAFGDFQLVAELGRGGQGRVFLATEPLLADRPAVLKLTPRDGSEHLSLARLQHTFIAPLYFVYDLPARNLRVLCMPYFGSATLERALELLADVPSGQRTGGHLIRAIDRIQEGVAVPLPGRGPARDAMTRASHAEAICWIGACLAEALHYAHERGLVHLDLKPSNVLLAADGQPMLLDFHLAQKPIQSGDAHPGWLGGTPVYMSPEHRKAISAVQDGRTIPNAVDGRADQYSLGLLLYESLGGSLPFLPGTSPRLDQGNAQVSPGLSDIVHRCLARLPEDRYPDCAAVASDLRRHLAGLPLEGVANRSLRERWGKWRRRRPHALALSGMLAAVVAATMALGAGTLNYFRTQLADGKDALGRGELELQRHQYAAAIATLERGLAVTESLPGSGDLRGRLSDCLRSAERAEAMDQLHLLADALRFLGDIDSWSLDSTRALERRCRRLWEKRALIREEESWASDPRNASDLLDLVMIWNDVRMRLARGGQVESARNEALTVLDEAEALVGPSQFLYRERRAYAEALGRGELARAAAVRCSELVPRNEWEHYSLGRSLLRTGDLLGAREAFCSALRLQPQALWPNFYRGICEYRLGNHLDATIAFSVCVAAAPRSAACYYNRALTQQALGRMQEALNDYDQALRLQPKLAQAVLNRGMLYFGQERFPEAIVDLQHALHCGADPAVVEHDLALVRSADRQRKAAHTP